jgi:predicted metal-dependent hydrolase
MRSPWIEKNRAWPMETIHFNGISCQVLRRRRLGARLVFHGGRLRLMLPGNADPMPVIERHRKWILEKAEWFQKQLLLAGQLDVVHRSNEVFLDLVRGLSRRYEGILGRRPAAIGFRRMKSKWGSCSSKGKISLNTGLKDLPDELIAYVVFHELAHLKVRNHGPEFKALIRAEFPDFRTLDRQLRLFGLKIL